MTHERVDGSQSVTYSFLCAPFGWFHHGTSPLKVEVVVVLRQAALALAFLHSLGIVTRRQNWLETLGH